MDLGKPEDYDKVQEMINARSGTADQFQELFNLHVKGKVATACLYQKIPHPKAAELAEKSGMPEQAFELTQQILYFENNVSVVVRVEGIFTGGGSGIGRVGKGDPRYNHNHNG